MQQLQPAHYMSKFSKPARIGLTLFVAASLAALAAESSAPGYVDFGTLIPPSAGGEFVEVQIKSNLISIAARLAENAEPEIAEVLRGLQAIRVNVVGLNEANRAATQERVKTIRTQLETQGWERIVTAQDGKQDVGVYVKTRGDEAVLGVVVTVLDGDKQAVLVNVVGDLKPEKLAMIGEKFNIDPLKRITVRTRR
jgi:hypothetical protein